MDDYQDNLRFQTKRIFNVLAKKVLVLLEDLNFQHNNNFDKLRDALPDEFIDLLHQADYFDNETFAHYRKRLLDATGEAYRELDQEVRNLM